MGRLVAMSDEALVARLMDLVARERQVEVAVLAHLGEVEARRLYLPAACSSMHEYCVQVLGFSDHVAYKRIRVARVGRRFPQVLEAMERGLHVSGALALAPHLTEENVAAVLGEARGKRMAEIEVLVARLAPRPDVPPRVEAVAGHGELGRSERPVVPPGEGSRVTPLAPERFELTVTISGEARDKLARARDLMRHRVPGGDLAQLIEKALDALIEKVEARRFGKTDRPRPAGKARGRYVPRAVRREVVARDGQRCAFVSAEGRRCRATGWLEIDHVTPVALGGDGASASGVRVLCRSHNQYEAERVLGAEVVARGRARRTGRVSAAEADPRAAREAERRPRSARSDPRSIAGQGSRDSPGG